MEIRKADYHIHSSISPDAKVSMEEMCEGAYHRECDEIVFTDHYEFYSQNYKSLYFYEEYIQHYFKKLAECREKFFGKLCIKSGMEFGQPHLEAEKALKLVKKYPFDYLIGSVHKLDNVDLEKMEYNQDTVHEIADRYYQELLKLSRWGEFDCMGHLDFFKRHSKRQGFSDEYEQHEGIIRKILTNVIDRGKGIELNTSGIRQEAGEAMPSLTILKIYRELGGTIITVGSDAHKPQDIRADFDQAYELLNLAGFGEISLFEQRRVVGSIKGVTGKIRINY
ncbi:MAG: histidinol-phosphatase HisJ family protein [Herbinix sp.]|nr:histidinol-phosphatase HisJ family protein [Herbinix sp.]